MMLIKKKQYLRFAVFFLFITSFSSLSHASSILKRFRNMALKEIYNPTFMDTKVSKVSKGGNLFEIRMKSQDGIKKYYARRAIDCNGRPNRKDNALHTLVDRNKEDEVKEARDPSIGEKESLNTSKAFFIAEVLEKLNLDLNTCLDKSTLAKSENWLTVIGAENGSDLTPDEIEELAKLAAIYGQYDVLDYLKETYPRFPGDSKKKKDRELCYEMNYRMRDGIKEAIKLLIERPDFNMKTMKKIERLFDDYLDFEYIFKDDLYFLLRVYC